MNINLTKSGGRLVRLPRKEKLWRYRLPLYESFYLTVVVTADMQKTYDYIFPDEGEPACKIARTGGLVVYRPREAFVLLKLKKQLSHNTIAHEMVHVAQYYCEMMGIGVNPRNHEPYAYMVGHLTGKLYERIRKWKLEVR